ncbi:HK97 family phage prohead protease [Pseudoxanthomonas taiwanensis]|uniref:HK97 family phage prohead protease n=1 Tax=Pseudoxanthomonas taiwanensis TaxID=176598 RepID=A0A921TGC2_9GAMM|nr:HK97 family phage prohead protease [Pseudoxanthomonas taiwanensis]KAF1690196.1 HK97 family phage prohead protease [Pseudoxanthomonas taiwanensis]
MDLERRFATGATVEGRQLVGLAAPYGSETRIADFREVIAPGAFARTLSENRDILALVDHDPGKVLGRTRSGSLELSETAQGLAYRITLPDTTAGRDLRALAERGDLGGVSIGFIATRDSWDGDLRTLHEVELHEISIVQAHPAYPTTTVSLRSRQPGDRDRLGVLRYWLETCR